MLRQICLIVILCLHCYFKVGFADLEQTRLKRRSGDQPPEGKCLYFSFGGQTHIHHYVCCNNCGENPKPCDGHTYHTASSGRYCDPCGVDNQAGDAAIQISDPFACGGCEGQNIIEDECSSGYYSIANTGGFCWVFTVCFQYKCGQKSYRSKRNSEAKQDKCFNLVCDEGETVENCPTDCCFKKNPVNCTMKKYGKCPPKCCGSSDCCSKAGQVHAESLVITLLFLVITYVTIL